MHEIEIHVLQGLGWGYYTLHLRGERVSVVLAMERMGAMSKWFLGLSECCLRAHAVLFLQSAERVGGDTFFFFKSYKCAIAVFSMIKNISIRTKRRRKPEIPTCMFIVLIISYLPDTLDSVFLHQCHIRFIINPLLGCRRVCLVCVFLSFFFLHL